MDPPRPFEVLDIFGGKSKSNAPKVFKFGTKRVPIEVNNWWKFGADISNHFWEIENWNFFGLSLPPSWKENNFQKLFSFQLGGKLRPKKFQFLISQKWFEISAPNFHQLLTSIGIRFVPNLKGIAHLKRLPCPWEVWNWNGRGRLNFWATPSRFW